MPRKPGGGLGCCVVATGQAATGALSDTTLLVPAWFSLFQTTSAHMPVVCHVRGCQSGCGPTQGRWKHFWSLRHPLGAMSATCLALFRLLGPVFFAWPCAHVLPTERCALRWALLLKLCLLLTLRLRFGVPLPAERGVSRWCSVSHWTRRLLPCVPYPTVRSVPLWVCRSLLGVPFPSGRAARLETFGLSPGVSFLSGRVVSRRAWRPSLGVSSLAERAVPRWACRLLLGVTAPSGRAVSRAPMHCRPATCVPSRQTCAHG